ncbi:MAG TPA: DUF3329 domain-containing protein [Psychromonas hadalis]|nr:DUF3329 domain-containing protein [Psychromonas hadalis]
MKNGWQLEFTRLFIVFISSVIIFFVFEDHPIASITPLLVYLAWLLIQLHTFQTWLQSGAKISIAGNTSGIFAIMAQHIHRTNKIHQQEKQTLKQLSNNLQEIISALPDASIVLNHDLEIMWSNQAACDLFNIHLYDDIGQRIDNLLRLPELQKLLDKEA